MINYENVYKLTEFEKAIYTAKRKVQEAERSVDEAKKKYQIKCSEIAGTDSANLEFSNVCCNAKGILSHVYHIKVRSEYGSSQNKCIFCDCDNFDCGY